MDWTNWIALDGRMRRATVVASLPSAAPTRSDGTTGGQRARWPLKWEVTSADGRHANRSDIRGAGDDLSRRMLQAEQRAMIDLD